MDNYSKSEKFVQEILKYIKSEKFIQTVIILVLIIVVWIVFNTVDKKYLKAKSENWKWYHSTKLTLDFFRAIIVFFLILGALSVNGFNVKTYVQSVGVIGIILSFALQDLLKDIIMGISIMFEGYYKVGDVVMFDGRRAKIVSFNIKSTRMRMIDDDSMMTVSNRSISQIAIDGDWFMIDIPIGYDVDLKFSRELCRECAKRIKGLKNVRDCEFLNTSNLGESCIEYRLKVTCKPEEKGGVRRDALAEIQDVFYENNTSFPYNVLVVENKN